MTVPTVNHNLQSPHKVLPYAPEDPTGSDFATASMNMLDEILSTLGQANDGLGPNWSAIERVVHQFHMRDVWSRVLQDFPYVQKAPPSESACACLLDTSANGIRAAVQWVADHYSHGTPITLLNRPIPKLTDANSWAVWRQRLLHYYDAASVRDAATYIYCVTKDM
nr:hypothetical protein BaRGS_015837 [Batillaria attramentaria]